MAPTLPIRSAARRAARTIRRPARSLDSSRSSKMSIKKTVILGVVGVVAMVAVIGVLPCSPRWSWWPAGQALRGSHMLVVVDVIAALPMLPSPIQKNIFTLVHLCTSALNVNVHTLSPKTKRTHMCVQANMRCTRPFSIFLHVMAPPSAPTQKFPASKLKTGSNR